MPALWLSFSSELLHAVERSRPRDRARLRHRAGRPTVETPRSVAPRPALHLEDDAAARAVDRGGHRPALVPAAGAARARLAGAPRPGRGPGVLPAALHELRRCTI